ncbi:hypothetical protein K438DRAFT_2018505 [Mycena galopus ATCC 62051]|nr:hypothetical protein K438DRAFT_2018505 [Mycena galopus ATCC 62051]
MAPYIIQDCEGGVEPRLEIRDLQKRTEQFTLFAPAFNDVNRANYETAAARFVELAVLFPNWHRVYVLALEQSISVAAHEITASFAKNSQRSGEWREAAKALRFPFWDWTLPETGVTGLPEIVKNPVAYYDFQGANPNGFTDVHELGNPLLPPGFDPIFFLHHTHVDRLLAFWEHIYPNYWMGVGYKTSRVNCSLSLMAKEHGPNFPTLPFNENTTLDPFRASGYTPVYGFRHFAFTVELIEFAFNASYYIELLYQKTEETTLPVGIVSVLGRGSATRCGACTVRRARENKVHGVVTIDTDIIADIVVKENLNNSDTTTEEIIDALKRNIWAHLATRSGGRIASARYRDGQVSGAGRHTLPAEAIPKIVIASANVAQRCSHDLPAKVDTLAPPPPPSFPPASPPLSPLTSAALLRASTEAPAATTDGGRKRRRIRWWCMLASFLFSFPRISIEYRIPNPYLCLFAFPLFSIQPKRLLLRRAQTVPMQRAYALHRGPPAPGMANPDPKRIEALYSAPIKCFRCGEEGHILNERKQSPKSFHCGETIYIRQNCPTRPPPEVKAPVDVTLETATVSVA